MSKKGQKEKAQARRKLVKQSAIATIDNDRCASEKKTKS